MLIIENKESGFFLMEAAGSIHGESGTLLEEILVGGIASVVWRDDEIGEMDKIMELVMEYRGRYRIMSPWL
jgi:hypothetical protein